MLAVPRSLLFVGFSVFCFLFLAPSPISAQSWDIVGNNYPGGSPTKGFYSGLSDAALTTYLFSDNPTPELVAMIEDAVNNDVEVWRYHQGNWQQIGSLPNAYSGSYTHGRAFAQLNGNLYAAVRDIPTRGIQVYGFNSVNNWSTLGPPFNANAYDGISGFTSWNGTLYVSTGRDQGTPEPLVFEWTGFGWDIVGDNSTGTPLGFVPAGTAFGNGDMIEFQGDLYFAGTYDNGGFDRTALFQYTNLPFTWNQVAVDVRNPSSGSTNGRTLVVKDNRLFLQGPRELFEYVPGNPALQIVGQVDYPGNSSTAFALASCSSSNLISYVQRNVGGVNSVGVYRLDINAPVPTWSSVLPDFDELRIHSGLHAAVTLGDNCYILSKDSNGYSPVRVYNGAGGCTPSNVGTLQGVVWDDTNNPNGIKDLGEPSLAGIQVRAIGPVTVNYTTTGASWPSPNYQWSNLTAGVYEVGVTLPVGWVSHTTNPVTGVTVPSGGTAQVDFGLVQTGGLSGYIWSDADKSCTKNGAEFNYTAAPVAFTLQNFLRSYAVNSSGTGSNNISLAGIYPGTYSLFYSTVPSGYRATTQQTTNVTITRGTTTQTSIATCLGLNP